MCAGSVSATVMSLEIEVRQCLLAEVVSFAGVTEVVWQKELNRNQSQAFGQQDLLTKSLLVFPAT